MNKNAGSLLLTKLEQFNLETLEPSAAPNYKGDYSKGKRQLSAPSSALIFVEVRRLARPECEARIAQGEQGQSVKVSWEEKSLRRVRIGHIVSVCDESIALQQLRPQLSGCCTANVASTFQATSSKQRVAHVSGRASLVLQKQQPKLHLYFLLPLACVLVLSKILVPTIGISAEALSARGYNFTRATTPIVASSNNRTGRTVFARLARRMAPADNFSPGNEFNAAANGGGGSDEVSVQTKHGLFKGLLLLPDERTHDNAASKHGTSDINDANVVGFLGIRYASAPVKRLRFMPPTAYHYAPNQVHSMQRLGPICRQRWPVDFNYLSMQTGSQQQQKSNRGHDSHMADYSSSAPFVQHSNESSANQALFLESPTRYQETDEDFSPSNLDLHMLLMKRMLPKRSYIHLRPLFKRLATLEQSEDCLNLNIYAPSEAILRVGGRSGRQTTHTPAASAASLWPVLVIIHGDSFDYGAGSAVNALKFVQVNRMLAVTFNYRLNILGFPPKLAGASRGNLGLMDQVAALHWIKDNIGSFGGAASNITLMGTKRGAIFVNLLMLSPLARGLFQRAIMEDGSALTPLIANQIVAPLASSSSISSSSSTSQLQAAAQGSLAVQHLRLLAKLCDCPVYLRPPSSTTMMLLNGTAALASSSSSGIAGTASSMVAAPPSAAQQQLSGFADETKANALTFECLRHKPIEQIMQRIPLDLLQFNQVTGEMSIAPRWLSANSGNTGKGQLQNTLDKGFEFNSGALNAAQLGGFVARVTKEQLDRERAYLRRATKGQIRGRDSVKNGEGKLGASISGGGSASEASELFGAIYGRPSASVRPLFAPVIDGTIVPDEDIAANMLKAGSLFAQRDLLIGLSQRSISATTTTASPQQPTQINDNDKSRQAAATTTTTIFTNSETQSVQSFELGPDHLMSERITEQIERFGLSSEQAIEMVNSFVRSLYRHHNQEISNSIINHYLGQSASRRPSKTINAIGALAKYRFKFSRNRGQIEDEQIGEIPAKINEQQLLVLDSLLEAFQDALTNVPVLKTALIHATKQLESLVGAFVGQQFEKWKQAYRLEANSSSSSASFAEPIKNSLPEQSQLLESFISFAQSLFNDSGWPLKLHSPSNASVQQPKGTYLFQFDPSLLTRDIQSSIGRLAATVKGTARDSFGWRVLTETLNGLLTRLQSGQLRHQLGLGCVLELEQQGLSDRYYGGDSSNDHLWTKVNGWLCSKLSKTLGSFVATGNVNSETYLRQLDHLQQEDSQLTPIASLSERIASYEAKCNSPNQLHPADHHLVLVASVLPVNSGEQNTSSQLSNETECERELNLIALDYLINSDSSNEASEFMRIQNYPDISQPTRWTVFNLFTQQIATLPSTRQQIVCQVNEVTDGKILYDQKSSFSARSSFWANFIPALNCSRTQPIIPSSLMSSRPLASVTNSSLLNLNLLFSCQHGSKSALDVIESLSTNIHKQLQAQISEWRLISRSGSLAQNHHTLRMANISQSSSIEENTEQQEPIDEQNSGKGPFGSVVSSSFPSTGGSSELSTGRSDQQINQDDQHQLATRVGQHSVDLRSRYVGILLVVCGLVISLSLASGACAVMRQRYQQQSKQARQQGAKERKSSTISKSSPSVFIPNSVATPDGCPKQQQQQTSFSVTEANESAECIQMVNEVSGRRTSGSSVCAIGQSDDTNSLQIVERHYEQSTQYVPATSMAQNCGQQQQLFGAQQSQLCTVQLEQQQLVDNNEQSINGINSFIYWNRAGDSVSRRDLLNGIGQSVTLCRSHSNLEAENGLPFEATDATSSMATTPANLACKVAQSPIGQQLTTTLSRYEQQEPIMLPIVTNAPFSHGFKQEQHQEQLEQSLTLDSRQVLDQNQDLDNYFQHQHHHSILIQGSNESHYAGSSSETQAQSSGGSSSVATVARSASVAPTMVTSNKKRVKISLDPAVATLSSSRRTIRANNNYLLNQQQLGSGHSGSQLSLGTGHNYCPVHRNTQSLALEDAPNTNYLVNDSFLIANMWDDAQTIDLLDQRLTSTSNNYDQFASNTTTPQRSYMDQQHLNNQLYYCASTNADSTVVNSLAEFMVSDCGSNLANLNGQNIK